MLQLLPRKRHTLLSITPYLSFKIVFFFADGYHIIFIFSFEFALYILCSFVIRQAAIFNYLTHIIRNFICLNHSTFHICINWVIYSMSLYILCHFYSQLNNLIKHICMMFIYILDVYMAQAQNAHIT